MTIIPSFNLLKNVPVAKKLYTVVGAMAALIVVGFSTLYFASYTLSPVKAVVEAGRLLSKSQNDAVYQLQKYHQTRNPADEQGFYNFMQVSRSRHAALLKLSEQKPDVVAAKKGLAEGSTPPEDIGDILNVLKRYKHTSFIQKSLRIWSEKNSVVESLIPVAEKLHAEINADFPSQVKLDKITEEVVLTSKKLATLEERFALTLQDGIRWFEDTILRTLIAILLTIGLFSLLLAWYIVRNISTGLNEILTTSKRIIEQNFSTRARVSTDDEVSQLASSLNELSYQLSDNIKKRIQAEQALALKNNSIIQNEKRISQILDTLIRVTQLDFSEKLAISDKGDEIDAIAVGLNTMSEEFEYHLQQLKHSEQKLNNAQRLAKIGNWEMDLTTNKVQWSDELYNVYGYGDERFDVNFEKALERMLPEDREQTKAEMSKNIKRAKQAFKDHGTLEFENAPTVYTLVMPDGNKKVAQGIGKIILSPRGEVIKMIGTVQDITEKDKVQRQLHQNNIELHRKNEDIEQFAYAASHDLQEPLRSISNFSKLLAKKLEDNPDKDIKKYMSLISGASNRMSALIFDLLQYSRIGKDMTKSTIDCNSLVQEVLTDLSAIIEESGAEVHVEELPVLYCYDLKSVFQNLILNGIKFKKIGTSPVIDISASESCKEFTFTIRDNGIGIEKKYSSRIFIIFQRLHTRFEYEGTGIGLSLCKKIIEQNDGKIWVESEFGQGSSFHFTIPKNKTNVI